MIEDDFAHNIISEYDKVFEIQFWASHSQGPGEHRNLRQFDKIIITNPVIIDVQVSEYKNEKDSKDDKPLEPDFTHEKQMLFLDESQNSLCWFTWKHDELHLNELDLKSFSDSQMEKI